MVELLLPNIRGAPLVEYCLLQADYRVAYCLLQAVNPEDPEKDKEEQLLPSIPEEFHPARWGSLGMRESRLREEDHQEQWGSSESLVPDWGKADDLEAPGLGKGERPRPNIQGELLLPER